MRASGSQMQACQLAASLAEEKRARKLAEDDALRLYNRVRQLQKEEERAERRIKDTKHKAASLHKQHQEHLEQLADKLQRETEAKEQLERQWQENQQLKQQHERTKQQVEARILAEKLLSAATTKEQRAELTAELQQLQASRLAAVVAKKEAIKLKQLNGATKIQQYKASKQLTAQQEYERRLKEELEIKAIKEQEIAELAQLELKLIERLKVKQRQQLQAAKVLEAALTERQVIRSVQSLRTRASESTRCSRPGTSRSSASNTASAAAGNRQQMHAQQLHQADEVVARAFAVYDTNATGLIRVEALPGLMADLGMPLNSEQLQMVVQQLDWQQTGNISFGQFLLWWRE